MKNSSQTLSEDSNKMIVYLELKSDQSWYVCLWAFVDKHQSVSKMRLLSDEKEKKEQTYSEHIDVS